MWVSNVTLHNIKSFQDVAIELSKNMNVLIGENNSGKSVIIRAINFLQNQSSMKITDVRYGETQAEVSMVLRNISNPRHIQMLNVHKDAVLQVAIRLNSTNDAITRHAEEYQRGTGSRGFGSFPPVEPDNFIYPFFAKRKVAQFEQGINRNTSTSISEDLRFLVAKVDRLSDRNHPTHEEFRKACIDIIGFAISTHASPNGKHAGIWLDEFQNISIESMGDGIPHLLGLITDLCLAKDKLFLIEELENDIHPKALKNLLKLIISKSEYNQFVISTHSNIVAKYLGSIPKCRIHHISRIPDMTIPTAKYRLVTNLPEDRRTVLEELGYEMTDYDLWKGWLILEESSAERIINDLLIPEFAPGLVGKLRTISANSVSQVEPKFEDFNRLFLFTHLEVSYKNKAWVVVDNGEDGRNIIQSLKDKYTQSGWGDESFRILSKNDFEEYYPEQFSEKAKTALGIQGKHDKRQAKKELLDEVLAWISSNRDEAIDAFKNSASEIIDILKMIEQKLL